MKNNNSGDNKSKVLVENVLKARGATVADLLGTDTEKNSRAISAALDKCELGNTQNDLSSLKIIEDLIKSTPAEEHLKMVFPEGSEHAEGKRKEQLLYVAAKCGSLFLFNSVIDLVAKEKSQAKTDLTPKEKSQAEIDFEAKKNEEIFSTVVLAAARGKHTGIINKVAAMVQDSEARERIIDNCQFLLDLKQLENSGETIRVIKDNLITPLSVVKQTDGKTLKDNSNVNQIQT